MDLFPNQLGGMLVLYLDKTNKTEVKIVSRSNIPWLLKHYEIVTNNKTDYMPRLRKIT